MNISQNWLKKYIQIDQQPEEIADILTAIGLEVEGIEEVESIKGGLKGLVVGEVLTCDKHPNADKLSVTSVNIGESEPISIVCGAPNVAAGQKVVIATVGTTLYDQDGNPWKIKKGKIRGEVSQGMICAEDEIGIGSSHEGIIVLDSDVEVGIKASDHYDIQNDVIFDVNLTPNRSDATSHLGVARDLVAYLKVNNGYSNDIIEPEVSSFHVEQRTHSIGIEVESKDLCPRYSGIILSNIEVKESPDWLKNNLLSIGVRPINNIVDITNYILHETGQPLHAFDYDRIKGKKIVVKTLDEKTPFLTLDKNTINLYSTDLMICDGDHKPMCMAGVFGGFESGVTDSTTTIFLESAHFNAISVRNSSMKHNLRTDSAKVFEKGSDPNIVIYALKRAAILIKELAGGIISSEIEDLYPSVINKKEIYLQYENVNKIIGVDLDKDDIHKILSALEMETNPVDESGIKVLVPTNKADVTREIDLIEEILRIYGFNQVHSSPKINSTLHHEEYPNKKSIVDKIADYLSYNHYNEMMNLSLIESRYFESQGNLVKINNTSNVHLDVMRPDMLSSGLISVSHNINRQQTDLNLFEIGKTYTSVDGSFAENEWLTLFKSGKHKATSWIHKDDSLVSFYDLKSDVNNILNRLGISSYQISETEDPRLEYGLKYHRGSLDLVSFGEVAEQENNKLGIKQTVFFAELNIVNLLKASKNYNLQVKDISKYPSVTRDLALVVDDSVKFDEIQKIAFKTDKKILTSVILFDFYKNDKHIGKGKKSYAVNFSFSDLEKTLNDKQIDKIMNKMISQFENILKAVIRK